MQTNNFRVCTKKGLIIGVTIFLGIILSYTIYSCWDSNPLIGKVLMGGSVVAVIVAVFTHLLFYVDVDYTLIKGRTYFGRKYSFTCSEITKVTCPKKIIRQYNSEGGRRKTIFYIIINTNDRVVKIPHYMIGFSQMAQYLLNKTQECSITQSAISDDVARILKNYASGTIYPGELLEKMYEKGLINDELIKKERREKDL